jgi:hypothetical protein
VAKLSKRFWAKEDDAPAFNRHFEVVGGRHLGYRRLGQSDLVLAGQLGEHGGFGKKGSKE